MLAHPCWYHGFVDAPADEYPPDGVEVASANMASADPACVEALPEKFAAAALTNSDAHHSAYVGLYHNRLARPARTDAELVEMLREGTFETCRLTEEIAALRESGEELIP